MIVSIIAAIEGMSCDADPSQQKPMSLPNGDEYLKGNRYQEAGIESRNAIQIDPRFAKAHFDLGGAYLASGNHEASFLEFASVMMLEPGNSKAQTDLATIHIARLVYGDVETLAQKEAYHKAVEINPKSLKTRFTVAHFFFPVGKMAQAESASRVACGLDTRAVPPPLFLGRIYVVTGTVAEAQKLYGELKNVSTYLVEALINLQRIKEAANSSRARLASARAWVGKWDFQEALKISIPDGCPQETVDRILPLAQRDRLNAGFLGGGHVSLQDLSRTGASVTRATALDPKTPDAYSLLANIDFANGKAKEGLSAAISADPHNRLHSIALATQNENELDWAEAKKLLENQHELDPSSPLVEGELVFIYLEHGGDINVAISLAQVKKQKMPNCLIAAGALGRAYYKIGSADAAISQLKTSTQRVPETPMDHYHLGMGYLAANHYGLAKRYLQTAINRDPNVLDAAAVRSALEKIANTPGEGDVRSLQPNIPHPAARERMGAMIVSARTQ